MPAVVVEEMAVEITTILARQADAGGVGMDGASLIRALVERGYASAKYHFPQAWTHVRRTMQGEHDCMYAYDFKFGLYRALGAVVGIDLSDSASTVGQELKAVQTRLIHDGGIVRAFTKAYPAQARKAEAQRAKRAIRNAEEEMVDLTQAVRNLTLL